MAVLLSNGKRNLKNELHAILDAFLTAQDYSRGIFIKPNIVFPVRSKTGEITPTAFVKTLITALREHQGNIDIILGEGVAAGCDPWKNFQVSGYLKLAHELNVPIVDLNCNERKNVLWKFGKLELPCVAFDRTYINLPILKPSSACTISGALKNQKGLLLPEIKKQFHRLGLHEQIAELNAVVQPALTIMDCSRIFGQNVLISGNNCGEIDATACRYLEIEEPEHVRISRGIGVFTEGFPVNGDKLSIRRNSSLFMNKEYKQFGRLRLWSNPQACTMCRYLFSEIQQNSLKPHEFTGKIKLLVHSIKGAEFIIGSNPKWQRNYETVFCVGNCTRKVAQEGGYTYIPGCPPTINDFFDNIP